MHAVVSDQTARKSSRDGCGTLDRLEWAAHRGRHEQGTDMG